ncbi:hypothetical protein PMAYCL1PPCAC_16526 [Pristionchus mayeri]|uniref:SHSP domain-containing protein n=1 Tax=Pristionchus mayeri TaxID=1317129 RepID=A0AAN5CL19_9BILA|nr:hypothetical protein PMAYCL1PPCAC_16526 [Pristionchus mayeri]
MTQIHVDDRKWDWPLQSGDGIVDVHNDEDKFEVDLDAQYFTPQEIKVQVIGRILDIHFEHNLKQDKLGDVSRQVTRSYKLPEDVDEKSVKSALKGSTLVITAAKKPKK